MIVIAVKDGYVQIDEQTKEIIEPENGKPYELEINGIIQKVKIIPVGGIVIDSYNKNIEKFFAAGGSVEDLLNSDKEKIPLTSIQKDGVIQENQPIIPPWIYSKRQFTEYDLSSLAENDFSLPFQKVAFIRFQGMQTPLFEVNEITDLRSYDFYRVKSSIINVNQCQECGKAFIAPSKDTLVCSNKCKNKRDNRKRSERMGPGEALARQIINTTKKRIPKTPGNDYKFRTDYVQRLHDFIFDNKDIMSDDELYQFSESFKKQEKRFWCINTQITGESYEGTNVYNDWLEDRKHIFDILNNFDADYFESWLLKIEKKYKDK